MSSRANDVTSVVQNSSTLTAADPVLAILNNAPACGSYVALGHKLSQMRRYAEAEVCNRKAIELNPNHPMAHNNLGWTLQMQGDNQGAVDNYLKALQFDSDLKIARRNLATLLVQLGRHDESFHLWHQEILSGSQGIEWIHSVISTAMRA